MSIKTHGVSGTVGANKISPGLIKARLAKEALKKELNPRGGSNYAVGIKPGTFKLVVNARSHKLLDKLLERFPDLEFQGIEMVTKVVTKIEAR